MKKPWENPTKLPLEKIFEFRRRLLSPFIKKYGKPVLVHSTYNRKIFEKILSEGKIKIPKNHNSPKMTQYMEEFLGIDNNIYYSLGFVYFIAYGWKYNFIFDLKYLKELEYYNNSVNYMAYKVFIDILYKYSKNIFDKIANTNKLTREVFNKYLYGRIDGETRTKFDYWKIEKIVFDYFMNYPGKKKVIEVIMKEKNSYLVKYPASIRSAKKDWTTKKVPEVIGKKDNNLLENPHFLGVFISGKIPKSLLKILKEKYPNKMIFDGKRIKKIDEMK